MLTVQRNKVVDLRFDGRCQNNRIIGIREKILTTLYCFNPGWIDNLNATVFKDNGNNGQMLRLLF